MQTIPVFFTFDRYYIVAAKVAIYSLLKHASKEFQYELYVLHTSLNAQDCQRLDSVTKGFPARMHFVDVSAYDKDIRQLSVKGHFSKEIFYKLIVADLFPEYDRILYTDVDVVFTGDISPSYFIQPEHPFYFAGTGQAIDSDRMASYRNKFTEKEIQILRHAIAAGYMLINLKAIREAGMQKKLTEYYIANYHRLNLPEQDVIPLCCWPDLAYLPMKYVVLNSYYKIDLQHIAFFPENEEFSIGQEEATRKFIDYLNHPVQLHYVGKPKPWNSFGVSKQDVWFSYMKECGCTWEYLADLPRQYMKKWQRLSLRRFLRKMSQRLFSPNKEVQS